MESQTTNEPPLSLRKGARIQLGHRTGTVECVRGDWVRPYEVRISWDGDKRPEYLVFTSLELEHAHGRLKVL